MSIREILNAHRKVPEREWLSRSEQKKEDERVINREFFKAFLWIMACYLPFTLLLAWLKLY